jgi:hypothetical protein
VKVIFYREVTEVRLRVFENRVLRRTFGARRAEVRRDWRKLHNEELNDLYSSSNIDRVIKSKRTRWAVNVASTGAEEVYTGFGWKTWGKRPLWRLGRRWRIILIWILRK